MKKPPLNLSDLLAHRDGEPLDLEAADEIEESEEARQMLLRLREIKHDLRELPGIQPPPEVWHAIQHRQRARRTVRFPLATAAGVFLATAIGIMVMNPFAGDTDNGLSGDGVSALMNRSQQLESQVLLPVGFGFGTPSQQALAYRIADVDGELLSIYEQESTDPTRRAARRAVRRAELWQQRIELLENLQAVQRGQALRPAVY
jgi:hypothetical protein